MGTGHWLIYDVDHMVRQHLVKSYIHGEEGSLGRAICSAYMKISDKTYLTEEWRFWEA